MNFNFFNRHCFEEVVLSIPRRTRGSAVLKRLLSNYPRNLASLGHDVKVYAPIKDDCPPVDDGGARWLPVESADFTERGFWVISRYPSVLDNFPVDHPYQKLWLVCQDVAYLPDTPGGLTHQRAAKLDLLIGLCNDQCFLLNKHWPECKERIVLSSNGIKTDAIIKMVETSKIQRVPVQGYLHVQSRPWSIDSAQDHQAGPRVRRKLIRRRERRAVNHRLMAWRLAETINRNGNCCVGAGRDGIGNQRNVVHVERWLDCAL